MFRTLISEILSAQTRSDLCLCVTCTISKLIFDPVFFFRWFGVLFGQRLCVIRVSLLHRVNILLSGWVHLYRNLDLSQHWVRSYIFKNNTLISICWFIKKDDDGDDDDGDDDDDTGCKGRNKPEHFTCNNK